MGDSVLPPMVVCISEMDILRGRNLEFYAATASAGKRVEKVIYRGEAMHFRFSITLRSLNFAHTK